MLKEKGCHGQHTTRALEELRRPEHKLQVTDLALPLGDRVVSLIGVMDIDPQRSLGDYQNTSYFLLVEEAPSDKWEVGSDLASQLPALTSLKAVVIDPGLRDGDWLRTTLGISRCDVFFTHFRLDPLDRLRVLPRPAVLRLLSLQDRTHPDGRSRANRQEHLRGGAADRLSPQTTANQGG